MPEQTEQQKHFLAEHPQNTPKSHKKTPAKKNTTPTKHQNTSWSDLKITSAFLSACLVEGKDFLADPLANLLARNSGYGMLRGILVKIRKAIRKKNHVNLKNKRKPRTQRNSDRNGLPFVPPKRREHRGAEPPCHKPPLWSRRRPSACALAPGRGKPC